MSDIKVGGIFPTNSCGSLEILCCDKLSKIMVKFITTGYERSATRSSILEGSVKDHKHPTVHGVGYDSTGIHKKSHPFSGGKTKAYQVWRDMLRRGYCSKYKKKRITYVNCKVVECWHDFQVFAEWFYGNYREGYALDKDILKKGNLTYCPDLCVFIPPSLNSLLVNQVGKCRTKLPVGVTKTPSGTFTSYCNNGEGVTKNLGTFDKVQNAADAYCVYKEALIKKLAYSHFESGNINSRVRDSLLKYKIDSAPKQ
tara:strand:+ start:586 stop:1350 length:765 start_codon:yes stop_codon:yes gene_type:complete